MAAWGGLPAEYAGPLDAGLAGAGACALGCLAASWLTGDYSWVDRLWSVTPVAYAWVAAAHAGADPLCLLMAGLATLWGLRLTWNFARKGGYTLAGEDYRWVEVQKGFGVHREEGGDDGGDEVPLANRAAWQLFNVGFICGFQHLLLWLLAAPALLCCAAARGGRAAPLNAWDALAAAAFLGYWGLEAAADQQQWEFQQQKKAFQQGSRRPGRVAAADRALRADCQRGFLTRGLFAYSRHPNFFAEQMVWWAFYVFSVAATAAPPLLAPAPERAGMLAPLLDAYDEVYQLVLGLDVAAAEAEAGVRYVNWTLAGPLLLTALFQGSTRLTEAISARKYPAYARYQASVSMLLPLPPRPPPARRSSRRRSSRSTATTAPSPSALGRALLLRGLGK